MKKTIVITGVSSGFGLATAKYLASKGYRVYGGSRTIVEDDQFTSLYLDVTREDTVEEFISTVYKKEGRIDVLINNAGVAVYGAIEDVAHEDICRQFDVNLYGAIRLIKQVLPIMRQQDSALIINVSSLAGFLGLPFQGVYSMTKYATEALSSVLRNELRHSNISVVNVNPGDFKTNITFNRIKSLPTDSFYLEQAQNVLRIVEKDEQTGADVKLFVKKIEHIIEAKRKKQNYIAGTGLQVFLYYLQKRASLKVQELFLRKYYKI